MLQTRLVCDAKKPCLKHEEALFENHCCPVKYWYNILKQEYLVFIRHLKTQDLFLPIVWFALHCP